MVANWYYSDMDNQEIRLENLKYAIKIAGNHRRLAELAGCNEKYLYQIVTGFMSPGNKRPRKLGDKVGKQISAALGKEPYWIDMPHPELWGDENFPETTIPNDVNLIPQFDTGGAMGTGLILRDQPGVIQSWQVNSEWLQKNVKGSSSTKNLCIVTGFGDSMQPLYNPGDPLLIDVSSKSVEYDAIYFFRIENEGFIKRLQRIPGLGVRVISENKSYETWTITQSMDFEVFGRVLKVWNGRDF